MYFTETCWSSLLEVDKYFFWQLFGNKTYVHITMARKIRK